LGGVVRKGEAMSDPIYTSIYQEALADAVLAAAKEDQK
jgi:hypothetical protein